MGQLPQIELLLLLERLREIQWEPGDGQPQAEHWLPLLKRIRQSGKFCQIYVSPRGARKIVGEMGGKSLSLVINETLTSEQGKALLDDIRLIEKPH